MPDTDTDWAKNGMTEAEWNALSPEARIWRAGYPRVDAKPVQAQAQGQQAPQPAQSQPAGSGPARTQAQRDQQEGRLQPGTSPPVNVDNPPAPPPVVSGAQVILTGDAKAAARGDLHGSIAENTAARDRAIAEGHVDPDTSPEAIADTLAASVGSTPPPPGSPNRPGEQIAPDAAAQRRAQDAIKK